MLYYVSGQVAVLEPGLAVIDCGGVGYGCRVTAYTAAQLKLDRPAKLYITESIREDAFDLYGFISREEQRCYELLTSVNGVGPKAAMAILAAGPQNFTLAVMTGDEKLLTAAQAIGDVDTIDQHLAQTPKSGLAKGELRYNSTVLFYRSGTEATLLSMADLVTAVPIQQQGKQTEYFVEIAGKEGTVLKIATRKKDVHALAKDILACKESLQ